jgi:hypothetical protein
MTFERKTTYGKHLTTARKVPEAGIKSRPVCPGLDGAGRLQQSCGINPLKAYRIRPLESGAAEVGSLSYATPIANAHCGPSLFTRRTR